MSDTTIYQLRCPHCDHLLTVEMNVPTEQAWRPPKAEEDPAPAPRRRKKFGPMLIEEFPIGYFPRRRE